jgi:hypothetical protein
MDGYACGIDAVVYSPVSVAERPVVPPARMESAGLG